MYNLIEKINLRAQETADDEDTEVSELPVVPQYITYGFLNSYLDACDPSVSERFSNLMIRAGLGSLEVEDTDSVPTRIREMFMEAI